MDNKNNLSILSILNTLNTLSILSILSILPRCPTFQDTQDHQDTQHVQSKYQLTACLHAGHVSFPFEPEYRPGRSTDQKLARFLHEKGVKNGDKTTENSLIMVTDNYANCIYHNHEIQITPKSLNNRNFQMINDLKRRFENADNFLLVQGCKPKVALLARLAVHQFDHLNLTAGILRGHRVKGRDRQWQ